MVKLKTLQEDHSDSMGLNKISQDCIKILLLTKHADSFVKTFWLD